MPDNTIPYHQCCGCGYCCMQARCCLGAQLHGLGRSCPSLVWQDDRYWCGEVLKDKSLSRNLAIGAGCSSPLFNTQRDAMLKNQKKPT